MVTGARYESSTGEGASSDSYWLEGTVGGVGERLIPDRHGAPRPRSADELAALYPKGTKISVLYNPDATMWAVQDESLRVIKARPDFWEREASRRLLFGVLTLCPVPLALLVYFVVRFVNYRRFAKQAAMPAHFPEQRIKWAVPKTLHKNVARIQRLLQESVRVDSSRPPQSLLDCYFGMRTEGEFSAWFVLLDSPRREIGEVLYRSCGSKTVRHYFATLLSDSTAFEGVVWSGTQDTLVCYRNGTEVCRVIRGHPEPQPADGATAASWWKRLRYGPRRWSVEVSGTPFGEIEMPTRTERRLFVESDQLRLPIRLFKEPQSSFRAFEQVIPQDEPLPTDALSITIAFLLNVAFRTRIAFRLSAPTGRA